MKTLSTIIILLFLSLQVKGQQSAIEQNGDTWTLRTKSAAYQVKTFEGQAVVLSFFGDKSLAGMSGPRNVWKEEIPVRGGQGEPYFTPVLEAIFPDRVREIELVYDHAEVQQIDGYQTLMIRQKDNYYPLQVTEYLRVLPEYDMIEKWIEVKNTGKKGNIKLENVQSGAFFLPKDEYEVTHLSGYWAHEFQPSVTKITEGTKTFQVKGFKSYGSSFFAVRPEGERWETEGSTWFGTLHYSGNWRVDLEKLPEGWGQFGRGDIQVTSGINFWDQEVSLKPGQSFTTPKFSIGYTREGMQGVSQNLAAYTRETILPESHRKHIRPLIYNSFYATELDVHEEQQLALARIAKEIGVEVFVIDDGWFKNRVDVRNGGGDWTADKKKFPNGLNPMIEKINAMGLDFGIWVEPENVSPNSDLYRAHPDWVLHFPNRALYEGRGVYSLNLARQDVYDYLYQSLHSLLKEHKIKFIKWDMNKTLTNPGFLAAKDEEQRAVRLKYVENLYKLIDALRKDFPDVWFENCSGGGGRVDLGIMSLMDFNWASDNTDPVDRIFIQYSYLNAFPANTMIGWVTHEDHHNLNHPLEYKFDVSMAGVLGVGYDITKWGEEEKKIAKEKIAQYKDIREIVQFGTHYRLLSPYENNRSVLQYVNKEQTESVVFVYNLGEYPEHAIPETRRTDAVRLRGLNPERSYTIEGIQGVFKGDYLMEGGIKFPLKGAFKSQIFKIREVK